MQDKNLRDILVHGKTNRIVIWNSDTCDERCIFCAEESKETILKSDIWDTSEHNNISMKLK